MILILDYGMGNVISIKNALSRLGYECTISNKIEDIDRSTHLILPGVGAFNAAMEKLNNLNLINKIRSYAIKDKKPILGICLGMQILGISSEEGGKSNGLAIINNPVIKFKNDPNYPTPHVGFNSVTVNNNSDLFNNIPFEPDFYFTHSYYMQAEDKSACYTYCNYGVKFVASFNYQNIHGSQFHPEKSQDNGLLFIKNFLESDYA